MDRLIYCNDRIIDAVEARLPATTAGVLYGWGVFTTLRLYGGEVFAFDRHWGRLIRNADQARVPVPLSLDQARIAILDLVAANGTVDGRARITLLRGAAGAWSFGPGRDSELLIFTSSDLARVRRDAAITVSPYRLLSHGPLAGVKRIAMIENMLALEEARSRGFTEAVMVNERGEIVGATAANIFWIEGDELFTPSLATGCIPGVTRGFVLEIAQRTRLHVVEGGFPVHRLLDAAEVFLTSTAREIAPVTSFDIKEYKQKEARVAKLIRREFQKLKRNAKITR